MIELIQQRLESYRAENPVEESQVLKEIMQEIILYCLWRADFFSIAAFQGGTCLRILHQLPRFSEDLDFILKTPDKNFQWQSTLTQVMTGLAEFGLKSAVREALLKDNSIGQQLNLRFYEDGGSTIKIKLEIDVNPPAGSGLEYSFLDFPLDFEVCNQDLPSNFALKLHALLGRPYVKGRDWYDFGWYIRQRIFPNLNLLATALDQFGPWQGKIPTVTYDWLESALLEKIAVIDWDATAKDVERFLGSTEKHSLKLWGQPFFASKVADLSTLAES